MGPGDVYRVPLATVRHGRARQTLESGLCWDWGRVLWVPGQSGQYSGKIRFIEKHGVQDESGRHVSKRSSDPREAYPEFKLKKRNLVQSLCIVTRFVRLGAGTLGKFVLPSTRGKWTHETCTGCH